jgi:copper chaperone
MITSSYQVNGMHCGHCVDAVTGEIGRLPGVQDVAVDLVRNGRSTVTIVSVAALGDDAVIAAIHEAGYETVAT